MTNVAPIAPWARPRWVEGGAPAEVVLLCFSPAPLRDDVPMSALRFGLPGQAAMEGLEVVDLPRSADPAWFDAFRGGALRNVATSQLQSLAALDAAERLHVVKVVKADPKDLTHLQAAWAVAKWLVARGASVVLDTTAQRFWDGADVASWEPNRPFALSIDVNVIVEAEPDAPVATVHTRGLGKFGRPELIVFGVPSARWDAVAGLVRSLALESAAGVRFKDGDLVPIEHGLARFRAYRPVPGADLHLNNDGLVVDAAPKPARA